ncbi:MULTISPECIES: NAD(P)-dependent oxidoreductase [Asaia]|uniref:6-phosphogluconate dehydrogenase, NAD-binding n=1 Tax=Asaia bogorensis TaxID=91915 RepID=A0A060QK50_9PROT|nr:MULTISPECIES: NAD(P)-dependent oxidoreductase [Asaia]ETC99675.1 oxidoreductase [Asaia sp. SF2.1]CDG39671.1 6-phosphogluconate dehydrogenase, NAD-binding [Asaia bogorensis]
MKIALIGLGAMGRAIATNLVHDGHDVCAWTRSGRTLEGVAALQTPDGAFNADIVLTLLSDDAAIRSVIVDPGLVSRAPSGVIHVVMSTISTAFARELTELHARYGVAFVASPVLGRPDVAAEGALQILAAGDTAHLVKLAPVYAVLGKRVWPMGGNPSGAYAAKIACNMMITMAIEAMAEAVVLTEASGVTREAFFDLILNTLFGSRSYQVYSRNIAKRIYEPGFRASLGLKDLRLATEAAAETGHELPMLAAVFERLGEAIAAGHGEKDWSIIAAQTLSEAERAHSEIMPGSTRSA